MSKQQRVVLVVSILASFVTFLDGSVVNVALPTLSAELGGGLTVQQWVVDSYLITLGALMLVAGSVSDLFGRKKALLVGLIGFGVASLLCAAAPSGTFLVVARALQGVAGALIVPSSLALIISAFSGVAQGKAIGSWTAWTGIAFIVGPLVGGLLIDLSSWRLIFAINVLPIALTLWLMRGLEESKRRAEQVRVDAVGAGLGMVGIGAPVYALIEQAHYGWSSPIIYMPLIVGVAALIAFIRYEQRVESPMLPMNLFRVRNFSVGNIATVLIYGGLSLATFVITIFVQQGAGYSAMEAGLSLLPITLLMFFLSSKFGGLAGRNGPRFFMTIGPILAAAGFISMLRVDEQVNYWTQLFPGVLMFGLGLAATVAPLTSAVLGSIDGRHAGVASAVNNAIARIAGLIAIAAVGLISNSIVSLDGFRDSLIAIAILLTAGGVVSAIGIRNATPIQQPTTDVPAPPHAS